MCLQLKNGKITLEFPYCSEKVKTQHAIGCSQCYSCFIRNVAAVAVSWAVGTLLGQPCALSESLCWTCGLLLTLASCWCTSWVALVISSMVASLPPSGRPGLSSQPLASAWSNLTARHLGRELADGKSPFLSIFKINKIKIN